MMPDRTPLPFSQGFYSFLTSNVDFDAPHAIEGSSNRAHFVGFDLDGFWEEIRIWKKVYVLYIYLLINLRIYKDSQNNYCTSLSNIIMYRRLLIVIELDKNVNMYSIICDLM